MLSNEGEWLICRQTGTLNKASMMPYDIPYPQKSIRCWHEHEQKWDAHTRHPMPVYIECTQCVHVV